MNRIICHLFIGSLVFLLPIVAWAAPPPAKTAQVTTPAATPPAAAAASQAGQPTSVDVEALKRNYWSTKGETRELEVVQNRLYTKRYKLELAPFLATLSTDPFLNVHAFGGYVGFNVTEDIEINFLAWKDTVSNSDALTELQKTGASTNSNPPSSFMGGGVEYSPIYGKLSLLGKAIVHYDLHLSLGGGTTSTDNGTYGTAYFGIGQMFYLTTWIGLRADYRLTYYNEQIIEHVDPTRLGKSNGTHTNFTDVVSLGVSFFVDFFHRRN